MTQCIHCLIDLDLYAPLEGHICPNCGRSVAREQKPNSRVGPVGPGAPFVLMGRFWTAVRDVIFRPGYFFSTQGSAIASEGGLSAALAFAVIVQWLASFFNFVWRSTIGVVIQNRMNDLFQIAGDIFESKPGMAESIGALRSQAIDFLFGAGAIVLTPFTTLFKLVFVAFFVHAAVRFFIRETPDRPHRFSTTLKILAYASAPWIFCVIPGLGLLLAWILAFSAAVIGLREVYRTTTTRAVFAVVFPELLFMVFLLGFIVLFLFLAFNVMRLVF